MPTSYTATIGATAFKVVLLPGNQINIDGAVREIDFVALGNGSFSLILDGKVYSILVPSVGAYDVNSMLERDERDAGSQVSLVVNGIEYDVRVDNEHSLALRSLVAHQGGANAPHVVRAPMPGIISRIEVTEGEQVAPGKGLLVLEAMKMENEIRSLTEGRIQTIHVVSGKVVEKGEPLVTIHQI